MRCPVCQDSALVMSDRQGIEIDYCPKCRGVWLDRGELDKIIERSVQPVAAPQPVAPYPQPQRDSGYYGKSHHGHYKHKSWLSELFD